MNATVTDLASSPSAGYVREPRFPFAPLRALIDPHGVESQREVARRMNVSPTAVRNWENSGVPLSWADKVAIGIGSHPACVWPVEWGQAEVAV